MQNWYERHLRALDAAEEATAAVEAGNMGALEAIRRALLECERNGLAPILGDSRDEIASVVLQAVAACKEPVR